MTTTATNPALTDQLTNLAAQLAGILNQKAGLEEHEKRIKSQIRELVPGPDNYAAGGVTITVQTNRRFNASKALPLIPEQLLPVVTHQETVVDKDKLKALLPDVFEAAQDNGDYKIGLK